MELRKAYIECEKRRSEIEIEKEDRKLEKGVITPEQHKEIVGHIQKNLETKILHLIL